MQTQKFPIQITLYKLFNKQTTLTRILCCLLLHSTFPMQTPSYIIYIINKGFFFNFFIFMVENIAYYMLFEDT